jgi:hypothetical protein
VTKGRQPGLACHRLPTAVAIASKIVASASTSASIVSAYAASASCAAASSSAASVLVLVGRRLDSRTEGRSPE